MLNCEVASPLDADAQYIETYEVSLEPSADIFFLDLLIPPDASVVSCQLSGISGDYVNLEFNYTGCFNLRCYKFAQAWVSMQRDYPFNVKMNVSLTVNRNTVNYVPCASDQLADTIMERLKEESTSRIFIPALTFANLQNSQDWRGYPILSVNKNSNYALPDQNVDYLIVGSIEKFTPIYDLMVFKSQQGLNVYFMSTQDIDASYNGDSIEEKTREFLKDAYNKWHMKYVLLVGNFQTLPAIPYYVYDLPLYLSLTNDFTSDYFYSTLEQPATEYSYFYPLRKVLDFPDFILGRFPFEDTAQVANIVNKTVNYETNAEPGEWVKRTLEVVGEDAPGGPLWEFENYSVGRQKDILSFPENLTAQSFDNELSAGVGSVLIFAHGSPDGFSMSDFEGYGCLNADRLNNTKLPIIFSIGCHTGKFDIISMEMRHSIAMSLLGGKSGAVAIVSGTFFTPYAHYVYFSAYNFWNNCQYADQRVPDADYNVGKAFYYFCALNPIDYMVLLGDPSIQSATVRYDLPPAPSPSPAPTPTLRPVPTPTPTSPSTTKSTGTSSSNNPQSTPQPKTSPSITPSQTPQLTKNPESTATSAPVLSRDSPWSIELFGIVIAAGVGVAVALAAVAVRLKKK